MGVVGSDTRTQRLQLDAPADVPAVAWQRLRRDGSPSIHLGRPGILAVVRATQDDWMRASAEDLLQEDKDVPREMRYT